MNPAALVIVLVGVGESGSDWAAGALQALREGLDRRVVIELRESLDPPAPDGAFVVAVEFAQAGKKARLQCLAPTGRTDKELQFKKTDRALDRGRAVGYALAVLLPELRADALALPEPPPPAPAPELPPAPPPPEPQPTVAIAPEPQKPPEPAAPVVVEPALPAARGRVGLEVSGSVSSSFVSSEPGFGAALAVDITLIRPLSVRAGGGARFGNSPLPGASLRELAGRLGLRWSPVQLEHVSLSVLAHGLVVRVEMTRGAEAAGRFQGAAEAGIELAVLPARFLAIVLALSAHTTFSGTDLYVGAQKVAAISPWSFAADVGLRVWP